MELAGLMKKTRTVTVDFHGERFDVVYRVYAVTAGLLAEIRGKGMHDERVIYQIMQVVDGWDITSDGKAVPVDESSVRAIPLAVLEAILDVVVADMRVSDADDEKKG